MYNYLHMENEMFKLIEINPINDAHAWQCVEAFNYYIIGQAGVMPFSDNEDEEHDEYDEHGRSLNAKAYSEQWTCLGHRDGDGMSDEYRTEQSHKALKIAFADFD